jgi:superfamily I DNA/RNA helicase
MANKKSMIAKWGGICCQCNQKINKGETIFWTPPKGKQKSKIQHSDCSRAKTKSETITNIVQEIKLSKDAPSKYQLAIFLSIMDKMDNSNLIVEAVAGSGKTWTIIQAVYRLILSGEYTEPVALLLAFNKHVVEELEPKFPEGKATVKTSNSFGYSLLREAWGRIKMTDRKTWIIFSKKCYDFKYMKQDERTHVNRMFWAIKNLVSLAKGHDIRDENELKLTWRSLADKFGVDIPNEDKYPEFESVLLQCYDISIKDKTMIDYDDMLFFPVLYRDEMTFPGYPFVFVDEAQDLNPVQIEMLSLLHENGSRIVCVGDTHQAIYGFRGADPESMSNIRKMLNCVEKPLSINYRCPTSIVEYAQEIVPHIQACDNAKKGKISEGDINELYQVTKDSDYILCRTMAPLVQACLKFVALGKKATVLGRNIGRDIEHLVESIVDERGDNCSIDDFLELLEQWESVEIKKTKESTYANRDSKLINIIDKADTIKALCYTAINVRDLYCIIDRIFTDTKKKGITLSTIHRCKGLENERIIIIYPHLLPHPMAKQEWEMKQEENLLYVAITRTQDTLIMLNGKLGEEKAA